jgi:hypothetical protein
MRKKTMAEKPKAPGRSKTEEVDPAPWLGRVGDGATEPSGEYISRELRELTERARAHREQRKKER